MNLRTAEEREVDLVDTGRNETIASLGLSDAMRDAHPGAIYHQQGRTYEVTKLDLNRDVAELSTTWADYYTQVLTEKDVVVNGDLEERPLSARPDTPVRFADVTVTERVTGFERRDSSTGESLGRKTLDLPETTLRTRALYFPVPDDVEADMRADHGENGFNGGIHAAEHGVISLFPFHLLCDRADVGGLSTPYHTHTDAATVFVYDGYPGGVGLTRRGFERVEELFARTARLIDGCDCADGCPACVQSPHCGNANDPLAKAPATQLLHRLVDAPSPTAD